MRGATHDLRAARRSCRISIHAPRAGSDPNGTPFRRAMMIFQSTLPVRGATNITFDSFCPGKISIHAPRAGSDWGSLGEGSVSSNFNPRSPCGERLLICVVIAIMIYHFNPRSPCGERPSAPTSRRGRVRDFNPRSPCGERPPFVWLSATIKKFQSTLPVRGATFVRNSARL